MVGSLSGNSLAPTPALNLAYRLEMARTVVLLCSDMLEHQAADRDPEVAFALKSLVAGPLAAEIQELRRHGF